MNKMPIDETMAWFAQGLHSHVVPATVWTIISWIAFFFKLVSLSFAIPIIGLILFDFCLWLWRLNRPPPRDSPQNSSKAPRTSAQPPSTSLGSVSSSVSSSSSSSAMKSTGNLASSQRRVGYSAQTNSP
ncbi:hypothetical protein F4775DRAFT_302116 [Biscogniauxia sp. FL1348]|nr:hypothetical protein F4775DRAFT_302116 [Biscogniauxia sp. FL1348]